MAIIRAKNVMTLLVIGIGLLVTLSACENSKHAEVMSTEDLWADGQTAAVPDADTQTERPAQSEQTGGSFAGPSIDEERLGLPEPLVFAPEPPPSPALPARDAPESDAEAAPSSPARVLPEGYSQAPRAERSPASDYVPDSPPQVFRDARVREFRVSALDRPAKEIVRAEASAPEAAPVSEVTEKTLPTGEPVAEPETAVAKLEPSDFVPSAPEPEERRAETVAAGTDQAEASELADVFFDFDEYAIRSDAVPVLEKNFELLKSTYKDAGVLIEGHCDERGTVEYNLELGKRRAQAVKDYLVDRGIEESRIRIVSYGKERPFCTESEPSCWKQNRRGHFVRQ